MNLFKNWRNKQLGTNPSILWQETLCLNLMEKYPSLDWSWHGNRGNFYSYCEQKFNMTAVGQGRIIINYPLRVTVSRFINTINILMHKNPQVAYLAINRYEFVPEEGIDWQEELVDCIDQIVGRLNHKFVRLTPKNIDVGGFNFVGVHGLDIYTYENH